MTFRASAYLCAMLLLSPAAATAVPLQDLFDGASLTLDDKVTIDQWALDSDVSSVAVDYSQIDVTAHWHGRKYFAIWYDFDDQLIVDNFDFIANLVRLPFAL